MTKTRKMKINQLKCRKCKKNFNDCKCPDKYKRYNRLKKDKKITKRKVLAIIGIILLACFLVFAVVLTLDTINAKTQNHSKVVYYNPYLDNNQKTSPKPCPCSG